MSHEVSGTVGYDGRFYNVSGHTGKQLTPYFDFEKDSYDTEEEAVAAAKRRSNETLTQKDFITKYPMYKSVIDDPVMRMKMRKKRVPIEPMTLDREAFFTSYPQYSDRMGDPEFEGKLADKGIILRGLRQSKGPSLLRKSFEALGLVDEDVPRGTAEVSDAQASLRRRFAGKSFEERTKNSPEWVKKIVPYVDPEWARQMAMGFFNTAFAGMPEAIGRAKRGEELPPPEGLIQHFARGGGSLLGFLGGAPLKVGQAAAKVSAPLVRKAGNLLLKPVALKGPALRKGGPIYQGLELAGAFPAAGAGDIVSQENFTDALNLTMHEAKTGFKVGVAFGVARMFNVKSQPKASLLARLGVGITLVDVATGRTPWDDRELHQKAFDYALDVAFLFRGSESRRYRKHVDDVAEKTGKPATEVLKEIVDESRKTGVAPQLLLEARAGVAAGEGFETRPKEKQRVFLKKKRKDLRKYRFAEFKPPTQAQLPQPTTMYGEGFQAQPKDPRFLVKKPKDIDIGRYRFAEFKPPTQKQLPVPTTIYGEGFTATQPETPTEAPAPDMAGTPTETRPPPSKPRTAPDRPFMPVAYKNMEAFMGSPTLATTVLKLGGIAQHKPGTPGALREELREIPRWVLRTEAKGGQQPDELVDELQRQGFQHIKSESDLLEALKKEEDGVKKFKDEYQLGEQKPIYGPGDVNKQPLKNIISGLVNPNTGALTRGLDYIKSLYKGRSNEDLIDAIRWAGSDKTTKWVNRFVKSDIAAELRKRGVPVDEISFQEKVLKSSTTTEQKPTVYGKKQPWQMTKDEFDNKYKEFDTSSVLYRGTEKETKVLKATTGDEHGVKGISTTPDKDYAGFHGGHIKEYYGKKGEFIDYFELTDLWEKETGRKDYPTDSELTKFAKSKGIIASVLNDPQSGLDIRYFDPESLIETHQSLVRKALSEGKPVPKEVLKDYPELAKDKTGEPPPAGLGEIVRKLHAEIEISARKSMRPFESLNIEIARTKDWISSVLTNDEASTDAELVDYFKKEGGFSNEVSEYIVSKRGRARSLPLGIRKEMVEGEEGMIEHPESAGKQPPQRPAGLQGLDFQLTPQKTPTKRAKPSQEELFRPEMELGKPLPTKGLPEEAEVEGGLFQPSGPFANAKAEAEAQKWQTDLFASKREDPIVKESAPAIEDAVDRNSTFYGEKLLKSTVEAEFRRTGVFQSKGSVVKTPDDVAFIFKNLTDAGQEHGYALYLKADGSVIASEHIGMGDLSGAMVDIKAVAGSAGLHGAKQVYFIHNHPSRNPTPSTEDIRLTTKLSETISMAGMEFKGQVIVEGEDKYGFIDPEGSPSIETRKGLLSGTGSADVPVMTRFQRHLVNDKTKIRDGKDATRAFSGMVDGPKVMILTANNEIAAIYSMPERLSHPSVVPIIQRLIVKHQGKSVILSDTGMTPEEGLAVKMGFVFTRFPVLDIINITPDGYESLESGAKGMISEYSDLSPYGSASSSEIKDSGPIYDTIAKGTDINHSGREIAGNINKAIDKLRRWFHKTGKNDLSAADSVIATPYFIMKYKFPAYSNVFDRTMQRFQEQSEIMDDLAISIKPYVRLKAGQQIKVDDVLTEGTLERKWYQPDELLKKGLSANQVAAYRAVQKTMDTALNKYRDVLVHLGRGQERLPEILDDIEAAKREGYIPLSRFGRWGFGIKDRKTGEMVYYGKAYTKWSADTQWQEIKGSFSGKLSDPRYEAVEPYRQPRVFSNSKIKDMDYFSLTLMAKMANVNPEVTKPFLDAMQTFYKTRGFKRHFIRRRDVPGFSKEMSRSLSDYIIGLASYVSRIRYMADMRDIMAETKLQKHPETFRYAQEYVDYVSSPKEEFTRFRSGMFTMYLGANVKSAALNGTQPITTTMPWLSQYAPEATVVLEMGRAYQDVLRSVRLGDNKVPYFNVELLPEDVREWVKKEIHTGLISEQLVYELMGMSRSHPGFLGKTAWRKLSKSAQNAIRMSGWMFGEMEKLNRMVSFVASKRIGDSILKEGRIRGRKEIRLIKSHPELENKVDKVPESFTDSAGFAENVVETTQFIYGRANRPRIARGWMAPLFVFRSFTLNYIEMLRRLAGQDKKSFSMALGILFGLSGVMGLPFTKDIKDWMEAWIHKSTGRVVDLEYQARLFMNDILKSQTASDVVLHGMSRLTPIDMGGSIGSGDVIPFMDIQSVLGVPGDFLIKRPKKAIDYLVRGEKARAVETLMPEALRNAHVAFRLMTQGLTTPNGTKIVDRDQFNGIELLGKFLSFQPTKLNRAYEMERARRAIGDSVKNLQSRYTERLSKAFVDGDSDRVWSILDEINAHNTRHEDNPSQWITITSTSLKFKLMDLEADPGMARLRRTPTKARGEYLGVEEAFPK